jgi:hypothetical protein
MTSLTTATVQCPYCDPDYCGHEASAVCRRCGGSRKVPASVAVILSQLRASRLRYCGRSYHT